MKECTVCDEKRSLKNNKKVPETQKEYLVKKKKKQETVKKPHEFRKISDTISEMF